MSRQAEALRSIPPEVPEVSRRKQKLGVLMEKRKERRQAAAVDRKLVSAESGFGGEEAEKTQARRVPQTWTRRTTLEEEAQTTSGRERTQRRRYNISRKPQKGSLCGDFGSARPACCCGAGVAPRRFGSGGAADILHDRRSFRQLRAAARPLAVASSLELGAGRRVREAVRRRAETSQQPSGATPTA